MFYSSYNVLLLEWNACDVLRTGGCVVDGLGYHFLPARASAVSSPFV